MNKLHIAVIIYTKISTGKETTLVLSSNQSARQ